LLSCTTLCCGAAPEVACCRLAPFHPNTAAARTRRYPSDITDAQWALIDPLLPDPAWLAGQGGPPRNPLPPRHRGRDLLPGGQRHQMARPAHGLPALVHGVQHRGGHVGLLLCVLVTAASVQDRDGARPLLSMLAASCGRVRLLWADGGYAGKLLDWALTTVKLTVTIVKRSDDAVGFQVLPRRWVVEKNVGLDHRPPSMRA